MITVAIMINGKPILARGAVNHGNENRKGETMYISDCGKKVWHKRKDGTVALAHKLLDLIEVEKMSGDYLK